MQSHPYVKNLTVSEGTKAIAVLVVAGKIEEIVNDPASGEFGFRKANLYLSDRRFEYGKLVHTPREPMEQVLAVR